MTELTGRDLDRAIAEMKGWTRRGEMWEAGAGKMPLPWFHVDWAAAGPLLEEMAAAGLSPEVSLNLDIGPAAQCAWSRTSFDEHFDEYASGRTGPEAIARAYVAWKSGYAEQIGATPAPTTAETPA